MSDIPSVNTKIQIEATQSREAVSESLLQTIGASVNYCLDNILALYAKNLKTLSFTSSTTWTVPSDVSFVMIMGCGGGGGGLYYNSGSGANCGGDGAPLVQEVLTVTPLSVVNVVIGSGGLGVVTPYTYVYSNPGLDSSFGSKIFPGATSKLISDNLGVTTFARTTLILGSCSGNFTGTVPQPAQSGYGYAGSSGGAGPFGDGGIGNGNGSGYGAGGGSANGISNGNGSAGLIKIIYQSSF